MLSPIWTKRNQSVTPIRRKTFRPRVEDLEDRVVPATVQPSYFVGGTPGYKVLFLKGPGLNSNEDNTKSLIAATTYGGATGTFDPSIFNSNANITGVLIDNGIRVINYVDDGGPTVPTPTGNFSSSNGHPDRAPGLTNIAPGSTKSPGTFTSFNNDTWGTYVFAYLYFPVAGTYTFQAFNDDGFEVDVGGDVTINTNGGCCSTTTFNETIPTAGYYLTEMWHGEGGGGSHLELAAKGPGQSAFALVGDPTDANNMILAFQDLKFNADLSITKTDNTSSAVAGTNVVYTLVASNNGPGAANATAIKDFPPLTLTNVSWSVVSVSGGAVVTGPQFGSGSLSTLANLPSGATVTFQLTGTLIPSATGTLSNVATVTPAANVFDPNLANNSATDNDTIVAVADLAITNTYSSAGGQPTYTITVVNNGPSNAPNVVVTDPITGAIYVSSSSSQGSTSFSGQTATANLGTLAAGASATFTVLIRNPTGNTPLNTATVTSSATDPNLANNTATVGAPPIYATGADAGALAQVNVYDARTGALKFATLAFPSVPGFTGGVRVAVGDVNADGFQDVICGAGPGGDALVSVIDGKTGTISALFSAFTPGVTAGPQSGTALITPAGLRGGFTGGVYVASGDVNGDGYSDIIVAADAGGGPQVMVFDGRTGSLLRSFFAFSPGFTGGVRVAASDLNGDGLADIITAAGKGGGPQVTVYDGATGGILTSFFAMPPGFTGGITVAVGDVNGDGRLDIITGAGPGGGPQVTVFDGLSQNILTSYYAFSPSFTGGVRVGARDVNGDGRADILTAAGKGGGPQITAFDSSTLAVLSSFFAYNPGFTGGVFVN